MATGDRVAVLDFNSRWLLAAHFGAGSGIALVFSLVPASFRCFRPPRSARQRGRADRLSGPLAEEPAPDLHVTEVGSRFWVLDRLGAVTWMFRFVGGELAH